MAIFKEKVDWRDKMAGGLGVYICASLLLTGAAVLYDSNRVGEKMKRFHDSSVAAQYASVKNELVKYICVDFRGWEESTPQINTFSDFQKWSSKPACRPVPERAINIKGLTIEL